MKLFNRQINLPINKNSNKTILRIQELNIFPKLILFHHFNMKQFQLLIIINNPTIEILFSFLQILKQMINLIHNIKFNILFVKLILI